MFSALDKQAVEFPLVIKGDVQGSVETIDALLRDAMVAQDLGGEAP
jgi:hypothetical protein